MLSVVMLSVVMMSVVAPQNDKALLKYIFEKNKHTGNKRLQSYICLEIKIRKVQLGITQSSWSELVHGQT